MVGLVVGLLSVIAPAAAAPGARTVQAPVRMPIGNLESATGVGEGSVRLTGWTLDPDTAASLKLLVWSGPVWTVATADLPRYDVWGHYIFHGPNHGFSVTLAGLPAGLQRVCVAAVNIGPGFPFSPLGCRDAVAGAVDPFGSLDSLVASGDERITASGWTIDPQTWLPTTARLVVDGAVVASETAGYPRPDVGVAYPRHGPLHGYQLSARVPPGTRTACVVAVNIADGADRTVACGVVVVPAVRPYGTFDTVAALGDRIAISGWVIDPDAAGPATLRVEVRAGPLAMPATRTLTSGVWRPDVDAVHPGHPNAGFSDELSGVGAGPLTVCITALNRGQGEDVSLGCRSIVLSDRRPFGSVETLVPDGTSFRVSGWAGDPDGAAPLSVRVVVDGVLRATLTASAPRPDVAAAFPGLGADHGYDATIAGLTSGGHRVCLTFVDLAGTAPGVSGDRPMPCGAVVVGAVEVGTTGAAGVPTRVGPAAGAPLTDIDRDGGVSVRLRDGSTLWLFGDSLARDAGGGVRYFVNNTAAWAPPGQPTVTRDASSAGAPFTFVRPAVPFGACGDPDAQQAMWPLSAVAVAVGDRDRVVAYFENLCIGPGNATESRGVSLVEWWYDPTTPPSGLPITGTVLTQQLFPTRTYGMAAVSGGDGWIYAYSCEGPPGGGMPADYGPCRVARVLPELASDPASYSYRSGGGWSSDPDDAGAMVMPAPPGGQTMPVASLTVARDDAHGVWVMAYSPWPGYTDRVAVRVATSPVGPWTAPLEVLLPGCVDQPQGMPEFYCYAGTVQPQMSTPTMLGLGYYDQVVSVGPRRGAYLVVTVPFTVVVP